MQLQETRSQVIQKVDHERGASSHSKEWVLWPQRCNRARRDGVVRPGAGAADHNDHFGRHFIAPQYRAQSYRFFAADRARRSARQTEVDSRIVDLHQEFDLFVPTRCQNQGNNEFI